MTGCSILDVSPRADDLSRVNLPLAERQLG